MSFDRAFFDMMPQSITYQAWTKTSTESYGTQIHSTDSKTLRARIQASRTDVRSRDSREVVGATFKLIVAPYSTVSTSDAVTVTALDKITLPTGFLVAGSCSPPIVRAYPVEDESGLHHNEVWL